MSIKIGTQIVTFMCAWRPRLSCERSEMGHIGNNDKFVRFSCSYFGYDNGLAALAEDIVKRLSASEIVAQRSRVISNFEDTKRDCVSSGQLAQPEALRAARQIVAERSGDYSNPKGSQGQAPAARSARPIGAASKASQREIWKVAEGVGFEPTERSHAQRFSRPPHSTTLPPLRLTPLRLK